MFSKFINNYRNNNGNNTSRYHPGRAYVRKKSQEILLSSLFAGYFILQIPDDDGWHLKYVESK
jgi:hypothetical protein